MAANIDALVAAAIHDAKNALLALDTQLAQAERRPVDVDFSAMRCSVARVSGQLVELLTLYRAQGGQLRLAIDDHDLNDFLDDLVSELGPLPTGLVLHVDREASSQLGAWAFDAYLVKLALLDALRNAQRHAVRDISLTLQTVPAGGICIVITDDGAGFPQDVLAGADSVRSSGGTGLGLSFARLIAERHATPAGRHGYVQLANTPGATLRMYLP